MIFNDNIIDFLQKNISQTNTIFYLENFDYNFCYYSLNEPNTLEFIIKDYETFYNKSFCKNYKYPLFNTYIIPNETYVKIMKWIVQLYTKIYPWCIEWPNASHFGHIGGIYERIMAYALGKENLKNIKLNVTHDHKYKNLSY